MFMFMLVYQRVLFADFLRICVEPLPLISFGTSTDCRVAQDLIQVKRAFEFLGIRRVPGRYS